MVDQGKKPSGGSEPSIATAMPLQRLDGNRMPIPANVARTIQWLRDRPRKTGCRIQVVDLGRAYVFPANDEHVSGPLAFLLEQFYDPTSSPESLTLLEPLTDVALRAGAVLSQISPPPPSYRLHLPPDVHPLLELDAQEPRFYVRNVGQALELFSVPCVLRATAAAAELLRRRLPPEGGS
jgi:hypothetical protein